MRLAFPPPSGRAANHLLKPTLLWRAPLLPDLVMCRVGDCWAQR